MKMIGMSRLRSSSFMWIATSSPSMPGMATSISATANDSRRARLGAAPISFGALPKAIEQMRDLVWRDAGAVVFDPDHELATTHARPDGGRTTRGSEFDRVADQILEHLEDALFVGFERGQLGRQI